jgi:hypothetical protein
VNLVDELDLRLLLTFAASLHDGSMPPGCLDLEDPEPISARPWGDVNCDGIVDSSDALYVLAYLVNIFLQPRAQNCTRIADFIS